MYPPPSNPYGPPPGYAPPLGPSRPGYAPPPGRPGYAPPPQGYPPPPPQGYPPPGAPGFGPHPGYPPQPGYGYPPAGVVLMDSSLFIGLQWYV